MRFRQIFLPLLILVFFFQHCKKEVDYNAPVIEIISPALNSSFTVPGKMLVEIRVESHRKINYVRVGIANLDLAPVFSPRFFYPDSSVAEIAFEIDMEVLPPGSGQQHYLHIAVDDGIKLTHRYLEVILSNVPLKYQGLYMITSAGNTRVSFYDQQYTAGKSLVLDGSFDNAEVSADHKMLFVSTSTPAKLWAFDTESLSSQWTRTTEMPYPWFTDLYADGRYLFVGYGNERIDALDVNTGILKLGTVILVDSVPKKIGVSERYFVGYFEKRTAPVGAWVSFYRATGATYNKLSTNISVVDFYKGSADDELLVIGNSGNSGVFTHYNVHENTITEPVAIHADKIDRSCAINDHMFVFSSNSKVFLFDTQSGSTDLILQDAEPVVDLQYNHVDRQLMVATALSLHVYAWPEMQKLKTIPAESPLKAVRLQYGF